MCRYACRCIVAIIHRDRVRRLVLFLVLWDHHRELECVETLRRQRYAYEATVRRC